MTKTRSAPSGVGAGVQDAGLLRVLLEQSGQGIGVYDAERRLVLWNDRWLALLELPARFGKYGTPLSEILLWQAQRGDFGDVDPAAETRRLLVELDSGELQEREIRASGGPWLHFRKAPIPGGGIASFVTDVTATRERDAILAERRGTLRTVLENMDQGIVIIDGAMRILAANQVALTWFDLSRLDFPDGTPYRELLGQLFRNEGLEEPALSARVEKELADPDHFAARIYERHVAGRTLEVHQRPLPDGGVVRVYTDVSERLRAEAELEARRAEAIEATRLLADALDNSTDGFVLWDRSRRLTVWNAAYARLVPGVADILQVGLSLTDFVTTAVGRGALQQQAGESNEAAIRRWLDLYQKDATYEHLRAAGGWMLSSNRVLPDGSVLWTRTDITHLKVREAERAEHAARLEELMRKLDVARLEAESASRAKSRFLAQVSHELRTPLNAVLGFSDVMRRQHFGRLGSSKYVTYAEDIHSAGSHLLQVINQILDLAKVEAGRMVVEPQRNSLLRLVEESVKLVRSQAETSMIQLNVEIADFPLWADRRLAKQALVNILGNAIKFTPTGGTVTVRGGIGDGATVITITDTGAGMTPAEIETALEPFGRVEASSSRRAREGTGLGLPLVKAFLELHGGRLDIDSVKGQGTTVALRFPLPPA